MPHTIANRRFLKSGDIPAELVDEAKKLADRERMLFDCLPADDLDRAIQDALAEEITASFEIEREYLNSDIVKSYVISSMGLRVSDWMETDWTDSGDEEDDFVPREKRAADSIMACLNMDPLSHEMIFQANGLATGKEMHSYRKHPEVVKAGKMVIYKAPEAALVPGLMDEFVDWWNDDRLKMPPSIGAAVAHYDFVAIHPFRDGNGRTARALAEKAFITSHETIYRPYSLSAQILKERLDYYAALKTGDPLVFVEHILVMHERAMKHGMDEARRLSFLRLFFRRDSFSGPEKAIIHKMSINPDSRWESRDFYLVENHDEIFANLKKKGVVKPDGSLNMSYRPKNPCKP